MNNREQRERELGRKVLDILRSTYTPAGLEWLAAQLVPHPECEHVERPELSYSPIERIAQAADALDLLKDAAP